MKLNKQLDIILETNDQYAVIGHSLWYKDLEKELCDYVAELFFFKDKNILIMCPSQDVKNTIIKTLEESISYYKIKCEFDNDTFIDLINNRIKIGDLETWVDISVFDIDYDYFFVYNNTDIQSESQLTPIINYFDKIVLFTLDYQNCIFYKLRNRYIIEEPTANQYEERLEKGNYDDIYRRGVLAKFDEYSNKYENN